MIIVALQKQSSSRDWWKSVAASIVGGAIWDFIKPFLKGLVFAIISSFPLLTIAIKELIPSLTWINAMVPASLITLAVVLPLGILLINLRALPLRPPAWKEKMGNVATLMRRGRELGLRVPIVKASVPPPEEIAKWKREVNEWVTWTNDCMLEKCTVQASEKFLSDTETLPLTYASVPQDLNPYVRVLNRRLENLSKIIDRPEIYL